MKLFKNLSIKNKIMLGIGLTFILSMFFLLGIVIYQFNDLSAENQSLIEKELLERKYDKYQTLVEKRAEILSKSYHLYLEEKAAEDKSVTESEIRNTISELNQSQTVSDMYYFIYDLEGETISLPPTPELEGTNRKNLEVEGRKLLKEMITVIKKNGGGRISYPYMNPITNEVETKYGYVKKIEGTEMFVGAGGYQSSYYNIVDQLLTEIYEIRNKTIYLLLISFIVIMVVIFLIIYDISRYINLNFKRLLSSFKRVEKGQLNYRLDIKSQDEFGSLAAGFNQMIGRIKKLTYNDPLTGLPNLNFLESQLVEILQKNEIKAENIYLFTLITENLTLVNSNYGYQKGNKILQELFQRLNKSLSEDTTIARKNDEFIFYLYRKLCFCRNVDNFVER
jgi:HAMP domain-containing protein